MLNQKKVIDALLFLEAIFTRLASLMVRFFWAIGRGLWSLVYGRRGPSLLSHKEIYAKNLFSHGADFGRGWLGRGLYIRRVGRLNSCRHLRVGQGKEVVR
jgi:hypothetical protein